MFSESLAVSLPSRNMSFSKPVTGITEKARRADEIENSSCGWLVGWFSVFISTLQRLVLLTTSHFLLSPDGLLTTIVIAHTGVLSTQQLGEKTGACIIVDVT